MTPASVIDTLAPLVPGASYQPAESVDFATIYVPADQLLATCQALRDTPSLRFNVLVEVTCADFFPRDPRFEVVYHLLSIPNRVRLRLKVRTGATQAIPTVQGIWPSAGWLEREVWDMFGIRFVGHPDLRRLMMPEEFTAHPLRKDYPLRGYQIFPDTQPIHSELLKD